VVEDDVPFAAVIAEQARADGYKVLAASDANRALALAREFRPAAITLDLSLAESDGWTVLDRIKHDPATRHVPVLVISVSDDPRRAARLGAFGFLRKPLSNDDLRDAIHMLSEFLQRSHRRLLVVEPDETRRNGVVELVGNTDVHTTAVRSVSEAMSELEKERYDCVVLDPALPDLENFRPPNGGPAMRPLPVVLNGERPDAEADGSEASGLSEEVTARSAANPGELLAETTLFLHRRESAFPEAHRQLLATMREVDPELAGRRVLVIDDDVRNIFALTTMLEQHRMHVVHAENGRDGITLLQATPDIDVVLMDVMMPGMDGYEAMRAIRQIPRLASLPIIAVTAKAMRGDREKCIQAGASAYIAKPVDVEQLLSLLRVAMCR
jgi:CheY-like chemotaxis protein